MPAGRSADLRPLSARSVVLSLLLGADEPELSAAQLVRVTAPFGITAPTLRVAVSRMLSAGDLERTPDAYRLSARLIARQERQEEGLHPRTSDAWDGTWEMVLVTSGPRPAEVRARLRDDLERLRLAEVREGAWVRPANLLRSLDAPPGTTTFTARPDDPAALAGTLWDTGAWAAEARRLLTLLADPDLPPATRLAAAAASVRHLQADPVLPPALLPADWPGDVLRAAYAAYRAELARLTTRLAPAPER